MKRISRAEMVLEIYDREAMGEVTPREIAIINRGLIEEYGEGGMLAPAEIARILIDEDLPVRFEQVFNMSSHDDRYERLFADAIDASTLQTAELSLVRMGGLFSNLERSGDRRGMDYARAIVRHAKELSLRLSLDQRLTPHSRVVQSEIAQWLTVWLQTPQIWHTWLELRKRTLEFERVLAESQRDSVKPLEAT